MFKFNKFNLRFAFAALTAVLLVGAGFFIAPPRSAQMKSASATTAAETDLSVQITDSKDEAAINETVTYTIAIRNLGGETATNVKVYSRLSDKSDAYARIDAARGVCFIGTDSFHCEIGELAPGAHAVVTFQAVHTQSGKAKITSRVESDAIDPHDNNDSQTISVKVGE